MTTAKFYPSFSNKLQKAIYEKLQSEIGEGLVVGTEKQVRIFDKSKQLSKLVKSFVSTRFPQFTNIEISSIVKYVVLNNLLFSDIDILNAVEHRLLSLNETDLKSGKRCIESNTEEFYTKFIKNFPDTDFRKRMKEIIVTNGLNRFDCKLLNKYLYYCETFDIEITYDVEKYIIEKSKLRTKLIIDSINEYLGMEFTKIFYNSCSKRLKNLIWANLFLDDKRLVKTVLKEISSNPGLLIK